MTTPQQPLGAPESLTPTFRGLSKEGRARLHAHLADQLIAACGGVDEILKHGIVRVGRAALYSYSNVNLASCMPADVMADLEAYSGKPLYSRILVEDRPCVPEDVAGVVDEACDVGEAAVHLQKLARAAAADGELSPNEKDDLEQSLDYLREQIRQFEAAIDKGRP